jgi:hypothetical protein
MRKLHEFASGTETVENMHGGQGVGAQYRLGASEQRREHDDVHPDCDELQYRDREAPSIAREGEVPEETFTVAPESGLITLFPCALRFQRCVGIEMHVFLLPLWRSSA